MMQKNLEDGFEQTKKEQLFALFSNEKSQNFLQDWATLLEPDFSFEAAYDFAKTHLDEMQTLKAGYGFSEDSTEDKNLQMRASIVAYLGHYGQMRNTGVSYLEEHIVKSAKNELASIYEAKEKAGINIRQISKVTKNQIEVTLHDVWEDVVGNLKEKILHYKEENSISGDQKLDKQKEFLMDLEAFFNREFRIDTTLTLVEFFTNFSQRLYTEHSLKKAKLEPTNKIDLDREDLGRNDFVIKMISARHLMNLLSLFSEKTHNLKSIEQMGRTKMLELYHFAHALLKTGFRTYAKIFLQTFFAHYLEERPSDVKTIFQEKVSKKSAQDKESFIQNQETLESNFDKIFGEGNYEIEYLSLYDWRIHEIALMLYKKHEPQEEELKKKRDTDEMGHYYFSQEMLNDPLFDEVLQNIITGRIIVKVKDEHADKLHKWRKTSCLSYFKNSDKWFNRLCIDDFDTTNVTDYYRGEGPKELQILDYKGVTCNLIKSQTNNKIKRLLRRFFKTNFPEKVLTCKIMTEKDYDRNEYGTSVDFSSSGEAKQKQILQYYKDYLKELLGEGNYEIYETLGREKFGVSLDTLVKDILDVGENKEMGEKYIFEIMKEVSLLIKDGIFLHRALDKTYVNQSF